MVKKTKHATQYSHKTLLSKTILLNLATVQGTKEHAVYKI
jgi:hypothetical protein